MIRRFIRRTTHACRAPPGPTATVIWLARRACSYVPGRPLAALQQMHEIHPRSEIRVRTVRRMTGSIPSPAFTAYPVHRCGGRPLMACMHAMQCKHACRAGEQLQLPPHWFNDSFHTKLQTNRPASQHTAADVRPVGPRKKRRVRTCARPCRRAPCDRSGAWGGLARDDRTYPSTITDDTLAKDRVGSDQSNSARSRRLFFFELF